jgi:hypothetical protein
MILQVYHDEEPGSKPGRIYRSAEYRQQNHQKKGQIIPPPQEVRRDHNRGRLAFESQVAVDR